MNGSTSAGSCLTSTRLLSGMQARNVDGDATHRCLLRCHPRTMQRRIC
jgi:hypothetical protein